ncbi:MAG TPA: ATP-binding SpoIIE family protein phosphatase [Burkholderiaceae bacterium]|nr:ATP-binding SpoIIE family protein phosphatase [Burkholderiaceae bacterium]
MTPFLDVAITESSQVGEARRAALRLASEAGFGEDACGRIALVATELGSNLSRHAQQGRLLLGCRGSADGLQFELVSLDRGPGMADVQRCLRDGFSTGSTPGTGLGAVQRMSSTFSVHSLPGRGSVILARLHEKPSTPSTQASAGLAWSGICLAAPGETVSGDGWAVLPLDAGAMIMVADGLGHGPLAAEASDAALAVFAKAPGTSPSTLLERAHAAMRHTRGAAGAIATLDAAAGTMVYAGAGNIVGRVVSGVSDRTLPSQNGTLGLQIRKLHDMAYEWPEHALVILHSDGVTTRWSFDDAPGLLQCDPAVIAGWLLREHARGRDDATVVVLRRA